MRIARVLWVVIVAVVVLVNTAASAPSPKRGGTLTIGSWNEPRTLGLTNWASDVVAAQLSQNIYNSLVRFDPSTGKYMPELATEWRQESPTSWIFLLRRGVQFHKGYGEMTADDVAFTVNHIVQNSRPSRIFYSFVKELQVVDRYTVRVVLERAFTPLLAVMAAGHGGSVQSRKAWEEKGETDIARDPVGTGPFFVERWVAGDRIVLRRFDQYWRRDRPYLDQIVWRVIPDPIARENLLLTGEIDFNDIPVFERLPRLRQNPNLVVDQVTGWNWDYMTFDVAKPPFDKKAVRQAISYALDREAINRLVYFQFGTPTDSMLPQRFPCAIPELQRFPYKGDVARARALLAEAGLPGGFEAEVITGSKEHLRRELQIIANQLKRVGIRLRIVQLDEATYTRRIRGATDFQIEMSDITVIGPDPDAVLFVFYHSTGVRQHNHASAAIDEMLATGRALTVGQERCSHYQKLVRQLIEESYYVYVANAPRFRVYQKSVQGFKNHPMDVIMTFEDTWLNR